MAIRFPCPGCNQPLEVDDDWAGQSVACPYCRRVITAPQASSWPMGQIPVASPAQPQPAGFAPPPPPSGYAPAPTTGHAGRAAGALVLAVMGAGLSMFAALAWYTTTFTQVMNQVGEGASITKTQELFQEMLTKGQYPKPAAITYLVVLATISSLAGLVMGIRSLIRQDGGRGMAITACIFGAVFLICPLFWGMLMIGPKGGG